ncbi:hypothetical protein Goshw_002154 [Gossypium schwendimanii]|uniref:Uncharacterized protein n=1 Tax=Gossypium schwendimanii TaxID=34291 RepID=A0A7J9ND70_GOSSC|nr:hypothetical protein [Gossypium schwendimanii]
MTYCMGLGYYYGGMTVLVALPQSLLLVAWPHILLLAALLRYCCWQLCCDTTDGFVPIIVPLLMALCRS